MNCVRREINRMSTIHKIVNTHAKLRLKVPNARRGQWIFLRRIQQPTGALSPRNKTLLRVNKIPPQNHRSQPYTPVSPPTGKCLCASVFVLEGVKPMRRKRRPQRNHFRPHLKVPVQPTRQRVRRQHKSSLPACIKKLEIATLACAHSARGKGPIVPRPLTNNRGRGNILRRRAQPGQQNKTKAAKSGGPKPS